jgi:hypothetical protein
MVVGILCYHKSCVWNHMPTCDGNAANDVAGSHDIRCGATLLQYKGKGGGGNDENDGCC